MYTNIRILEATGMTVAKYCSETLGLRDTEEGLLDFVQRNCLWIVFCT